MIRQQCRLVITNVRFLTGCFLAILFTFLLLYYQEINDERFGPGRSKCIDWALEKEDPVASLDEWEETIYDFNFQADNLMFSNNTYWEGTICSDIYSYIDSVNNYDSFLEQIISQRENSSSFPGITAEKIAISRLEAEQYKKCTGSDVRAGNYMTYEKFFSFGTADICLWAVCFLICFFSVVIERERGIGQLVFPSVGGGIRYFFTKLISVELITFLAFIIIFSGKLFILGSLYGYGDIHASIQSLYGYYSVPFPMSIASFFMVFIIWKLIGVMVITIIMLFLCSLPLSESFVSMAVFLC